jgi:hypothetical protein
MYFVLKITGHVLTISSLAKAGIINLKKKIKKKTEKPYNILIGNLPLLW